MVDTDKSATVYELFNEDPDSFLELNTKPARVVINGKRHYETPFKQVRLLLLPPLFLRQRLKPIRRS